MTKKSRTRNTGFLPRGFSASIAGLRASSALVLDTALQKTIGSGPRSLALVEQEAKRFVRELGKLKGSYVKIGQMIALFGEHVLPEVLIEALRELANNTPPLDWQVLEPNVRASLGDRFFELDIEPTPIAAASLAQVHRATIKATGQTICLKIQYPDLERLIDKDFDAVVRMLTLARWLNKSSELDLWLATMRQHLKNEIDYAREVTLTEKMAQLLAGSTLNDTDFAIMQVPKIYREYCSDTVIGMSLVSGKSISDICVSALSLKRRNRLAKSMLNLFFKELYHWKLLQTDPNFGNYLIDIGDDESGKDDKIFLIDFGSAIEWPDQAASQLQDIVDGGQLDDQTKIATALRGLNWLKPDTPAEAEQLFVRFCQYLLEPLRPADQLPTEYLNKNGEYRWARSALIQRVGKKGSKNAASRYFSPPGGDFILVARKLTGVFTFIAVLDAEFNGCEVSENYLKT